MFRPGKGFASILLGSVLALTAAARAPAAAEVATIAGEPAPGIHDADLAAIRLVVERSVVALQKTDAEEAYALIAPQAHQMFPTKQLYLAAMLERFASLAYSTWFEIGEARHTSLGAVQMIRFADRRGKSFLGFFTLAHSPGGWRITGLIVVESPSDQA